VRDAQRDGRGVVALETTLVAHGFPPGEGVSVGLASEEAVRDGGSVPATIGVLDGVIQVGLTTAQLERFDASARKLGPRDIAAAVVQRAAGATTAGGTLSVCRAAGIRFMATGGLGGVHRGWPTPPDVSADLQVLATTQALVVSSGVKSLLDVVATAELLETLGVPVLGWRSDTLPLFFAAAGGPPVSARLQSAGEVADVAAAHRELPGPAARSGHGRAPRRRRAAHRTLRRGGRTGNPGARVTPFVLGYLHERSGAGRRANRDLTSRGTPASPARSPRAAHRSQISQRPFSCTRRPSAYKDPPSRRSADPEVPALGVRAGLQRRMPISSNAS
jgi:pseudouridine-5'-phosphate glycosidase